MPVADELWAIAERADRELDAVHNIFEHSTIVWLQVVDQQLPCRSVAFLGAPFSNIPGR